ncbi:MAG TPA: peptide chain release factor N(5)-glutamine methyltransferase [Patescibacteria group bacterium]|nr:peptide chain release factor N(5)-glutamine methyltransferase [Patescibacteria group bacterium]
MTIKQALTTSSQKLKQKGLEASYLEAEILLAHALSKDRVWLLSHSEDKISWGQTRKYRRLIRRRLSGWPVAYLLGYQEFFNSNFLVNRHTLIPRPETELLVETAIELAPSQSPREIVDIGTGSGCIIISLAKNMPHPTVAYTGIDISRLALKTAQINAARNGVAKKIKWLKGDLLSPILTKEFSFPLIITANLPYLTPEQFAASPSIQKEPRLALISGLDGLDAYRRFFKQSIKLKAKDITFVLEIDPSQNQAIRKLAKEYWPQAETSIKIDLRGQERIVVIKIKNQ